MNDSFSALEDMDDEELSQELREATEDGNLQQVQFLICFMNEYSPGFFLNHKDPFDHTNALFCAVGKSDIAITTLLLQHGADPNEVNGFENLTPLHVATSHHIIQLLIGANANLNATSSDGSTPLHMALLNDAPIGTVFMMMDNGADPSLRNLDGNNAFEMALSRGMNNHARLMVNDNNRNIVDVYNTEDGNFPIHLVASKNDISII